MPYNPLWLDKCDTIGIDKKYFYNKWMSKSELASIRELFKDFSSRKVLDDKNKDYLAKILLFE
jgi:hypothetical protein